MKHLKLFEAFESDSISGVLKYIKTGKSDFLKDLKSLKDYFDIPIDKIKTEDLTYISAKKAINLVPDESTKYYNENNIFNIKFWFSVEDGYLGKSATGIPVKNKTFTHLRNKPFNDRMLEYIKKEFNINEETISPVVDYGKLNTGDKVIGIFNSVVDLERLVPAIIYIDSVGYIYAIQNVSEGSSPTGYDWKIYGNYSWSLGQPHSPGEDHKFLHHLDTAVDNDIMDYNLIGGDIVNIKKRFRQADYAIVLDLNNIFKRGFKKVSGIRKEREETRKGATSLITDSEIKSMNIKRYFKSLLSKMGIKENSDIKELKNLQNLVKNIIGNELSFYYLTKSLNNTTIISNIFRFSKTLKDMIKFGEDFSKILKEFERIKVDIYKDDVKLLLDTIEENGDDKIKKLFSNFNKIGEVISNSINSSNIDNLYDLNAVYYKLRIVNDLLNDDNYYFSRNTRLLLNYKIDKDDIIQAINGFNTDDLDLDIEKSEYLLKNIKSTFN